VIKPNKKVSAFLDASGENAGQAGIAAGLVEPKQLRDLHIKLKVKQPTPARRRRD